MFAIVPSVGCIFRYLLLIGLLTNLVLTQYLHTYDLLIQQHSTSLQSSFFSFLISKVKFLKEKIVTAKQFQTKVKTEGNWRGGGSKSKTYPLRTPNTRLSIKNEPITMSGTKQMELKLSPMASLVQRTKRERKGI